MRPGSFLAAPHFPAYGPPSYAAPQQTPRGATLRAAHPLGFASHAPYSPSNYTPLTPRQTAPARTVRRARSFSPCRVLPRGPESPADRAATVEQPKSAPPALPAQPARSVVPPIGSIISQMEESVQLCRAHGIRLTQGFEEPTEAFTEADRAAAALLRPGVLEPAASAPSWTSAPSRSKEEATASAEPPPGGAPPAAAATEEAPRAHTVYTPAPRRASGTAAEPVRVPERVAEIEAACQASPAGVAPDPAKAPTPPPTNAECEQLCTPAAPAKEEVKAPAASPFTAPLAPAAAPFITALNTAPTASPFTAPLVPAGGGKQGADPDAHYDAEGRKLLTQIVQVPVIAGTYNDLDLIATHPSGGKVYVGGVRAAQSRQILDAHGIRHVVNMQDVSTENFHERNPEFTYLRFPISKWYFADQDIASGDPAVADRAVQRYLGRLFEFGDPVLAAGGNILLHCLAGAHRAGTAGVCYLMHLEGRPFAAALQIATQRRPIINPCGNLLQLAMIFDDALGRSGRSTPPKDAATAGKPRSPLTSKLSLPRDGSTPRSAYPSHRLPTPRLSTGMPRMPFAMPDAYRQPHVTARAA